MKYLIILIALTLNLSAQSKNDWNALRLELHKLTVKKIAADEELKKWDRQVVTMYEKLDRLVAEYPPVIELRKQLASASPAQKAVLQHQLDVVIKDFFTSVSEASTKVSLAQGELSKKQKEIKELRNHGKKDSAAEIKAKEEKARKLEKEDLPPLQKALAQAAQLLEITRSVPSEEAKEILAVINELNKKIAAKLAKDPQISGLQQKLAQADR